MKIEKTQIRFRGKMYEVRLEDGRVSYLDPRDPHHPHHVSAPPGQTLTSIEAASNLAMQVIGRRPKPFMPFSD
jgi:hypothetical protein